MSGDNFSVGIRLDGFWYCVIIALMSYLFVMIENSIILGDCLQHMKQFPEKSFDCILTDPPYLTTDLAFDKEGFDVDQWIEACLHCLKDNGYLISFGSIELLAKILTKFTIRWSGCWLKSGSTMRTKTAKKPRGQMESYVVFVKPNSKISELTFNQVKIPGEPYRTIGRRRMRRDGKDCLYKASPESFTKDGYVMENDGWRYQTDVIKEGGKSQMPLQERTEHPTQKPVNVYKTLLEFCTNENDLVLDPFAGSGTLAVAATQLNRRYVCIEKNPEYYAMILDRLSRAGIDTATDNNGQVEIKTAPYSQLSLF